MTLSSDKAGLETPASRCLATSATVRRAGFRLEDVADP